MDDDSERLRWVFWAANGGYLLGDFDGTSFRPHTDVLFAHHGNHSYAAQTWSDAPGPDGRRLQVSWATFDLPGMPFNKFMTFPCVLSLRTTPEGERLCMQPVEQIAKLYGQTWSRRNQPLTEGNDVPIGLTGELLDIRATIALGAATAVGLIVRGVPVTYDTQRAELFCADRRAPLTAEQGVIRLRLLVDRVSLEIFANDGLLAMPMGLRFDETQQHARAFARGGTATMVELDVATLRSIWPQTTVPGVQGTPDDQ